MDDVKHRTLLIRLASREYLPWAGFLLCWILIAAGISVADTARLFAVAVLTRAARGLTAVETRPMLQARIQAGPNVRGSAFGLAARLELVSLLANMAVMLIIIAGVQRLHHPGVANMAYIMMLGLPARHLYFLAVEQLRPGLFRAIINWSGVLLVGLALALRTGPVGMALALALREWITLGLILMMPRARNKSLMTLDAPPTWREVAQVTAVRTRRRLNYRISKTLLGAVLGPFGGMLARTGRGVGLNRKLDLYLALGRHSIGLIGSGTLVAAILGQIAFAKPATLILSASLLRISAAAFSTLFWWSIAGEISAQARREEDSDDDDDD